MRNNIIVYLPLVLLIVLYGCEQSVEGIDVPYNELLVVEGVLEAGRPVKNIRITRTLPPLEIYSLSASEIKDAIASIECDNINYPLNYKNNGLYDTQDLIAESGKYDKITVKWNGKIAFSGTRIPFEKSLDSAYYGYISVPHKYTNTMKEFIIKYHFKPDSNTVYLNTFIVLRTVTFDKLHKDTIFLTENQVWSMSDLGPNGDISKQKGGLYVYSSGVSYSLLAEITESYDTPFKDFYTTYNNYTYNDDIVTLNLGRNISWNVKGDGIGVFIGRAVNSQKISGQ